MKIELEDLFIQNLKDEINLFTGAGFSVLLYFKILESIVFMRIIKN